MSVAAETSDPSPDAARARLEASLIQAVVEQMPAGVIVFNPQTRLPDLANAAVEEILARPVAEAIQVFSPLLNEALDTGTIFTDEHLAYERPDRVRRMLSVNAAPIRMDGRIVAGVIAFTDITDRELAKRMHELADDALRIERKQAEAALEEMNASLERRVAERTAALNSTNQELEAFSYSVSHDLRAPLRAIDGFSQMLVEDFAKELGSDGQHQLARIRASTKRMAQLIDDLLLLSRVTRHDLRITDVNITAIARDVIDDLRSRQPATRTIEAVVEDGLKVRGDERLLRVLFENLIGNAFKFTGKTDAPWIEVRAIRLEGTFAGEEAERAFVVSDNGAGFDEKLVDKLFRPFQRLHTEKEFEGTGIGLATARRIVSRLGGKIWAQGRPGAGAKLSFTLDPHPPALFP